MTPKKIRYEKPLLMNLMGREVLEAKGQLKTCSRGKSASGDCRNGQFANATCIAGPRAVGVFCANGAQVQDPCYPGASANPSGGG